MRPSQQAPPPERRPQGRLPLPPRRPGQYRDLKFTGTDGEYQEKLAQSTTVYVGNLSFFTTEGQIWELFRKAGEVTQIIMGVNRMNLNPCGFCFVEYCDRDDTLASVQYINQTVLDDRTIRVDIDPGFVQGREFGRGRSGGQVRDDYRKDYDHGRGGWGSLQASQMTVNSGQFWGSSAPVGPPVRRDDYFGGRYGARWRGGKRARSPRRVPGGDEDKVVDEMHTAKRLHVEEPAGEDSTVKETPMDEK